jgi:hypothetical protein
METVLPGLGRVGVGSGAGKGQGEGRRTARPGRGEECRDRCVMRANSKRSAEPGDGRASQSPANGSSAYLRRMYCTVHTTYVCVYSITVLFPIAPLGSVSTGIRPVPRTVLYGEPERVPPHGSSCAHSFY